MPDPSPPDRAAAELRAFLADRDVVCPGCGYNLRGLTAEVCPECRDRIELRVGMAEPKLGALLVAITGLLAGSGSGVLFFLMFAYAFARYGISSGPSWNEIGGVFMVVFIAVVILSTLACLLARRRGRYWFRRRTRRSRLALAVSAWLLSFGFFLLAVAAGS